MKSVTPSMPRRAHPGDAGVDVCALVDVELAPGETRAVPTGLVLHIPLGYEVQVRPRSGISMRTPLRLPNSPGTIDHGYRDELLILVHNSSCRCMCEDEGACYGLEDGEGRQGRYRIRAGERIAQLVVAQLAPLDLCEIDGSQLEAEAAEETPYDRGGGFGSTGLRA